MTIRIQESGVNGTNTEYTVNYSKYIQRKLIVPNNQKDEFVTSYKKMHDKNALIDGIAVVASAPIGFVLGSKLVNKFSKEQPPSILKKTGIGTIAAILSCITTSCVMAIVSNSLDTKIKNKFNVKTLPMSNENIVV